MGPGCVGLAGRHEPRLFRSVIWHLGAPPRGGGTQDRRPFTVVGRRGMLDEQDGGGEASRQRPQDVAERRERACRCGEHLHINWCS